MGGAVGKPAVGMLAGSSKSCRWVQEGIEALVAELKALRCVGWISGAQSTFHDLALMVDFAALIHPTDLYTCKRAGVGV